MATVPKKVGAKVPAPAPAAKAKAPVPAAKAAPAKVVPVKAAPVASTKPVVKAVPAAPLKKAAPPVAAKPVAKAEPAPAALTPGQKAAATKAAKAATAKPVAAVAVAAPAPKKKAAPAPAAKSVPKPPAAKPAPAVAEAETVSISDKVGRKELATLIQANLKAQGFGFPLQMAQAVCAAYEETVASVLSLGSSVVLPGFGQFIVKEKEAAIRRNPATNEDVEVPAHKQIRFKVGKSFKTAVNGGAEAPEEAEEEAAAE